MTQGDMISNTIIVTGDVVVDHHLYAGERTSLSAQNRRGMRPVRKLGGAAGLAKLLATVLQDDPGPRWSAKLGITTPDINALMAPHHAFAVWEPMQRLPDSKKPEKLVWRIRYLMGYGHEMSLPQDAGAEPTDYKPCPLPNLPVPSVLVLDDGGAGFRSAARQDCWLLPSDQASAPAWILLKTSYPIAQGDLWKALVPRFSDRLVCLVSAHDLRREYVGISDGLSWERTIGDLCTALHSNPVLHQLGACRHLVVTFSADAALWLDQSKVETPRAVLCFDAERAEGEWSAASDGKAIGYMTGMGAALARALALCVPPIGPVDHAADLELMPAIEAGLTAMRNLEEFGHGELDDRKPPKGYPYPRIAGVIRHPEADFARMRIPWPTSDGALGTWVMVERSQRAIESSSPPSVIGLARQVALQGEAALHRLPHARFDKLLTADRSEIETLRRLRTLMNQYRDDKEVTTPISFGVFGPPGAGKSFGVKQLAIQCFGEQAWLEFNLSQFSPPKDLIGALHQARDRVLRGITPVVFWDEFDTRQFEWLQYLLAPMQDGRFQARQLHHSTGKCVFVFAGGTSPTFEMFGRKPGPGAPDWAVRSYRDFVLRKGPDFKSRLDAYYNVLGPNQRLKWNPAIWSDDDPAVDPTDIGYPLRRALLLRGLLHCKPDAALDIDPDLLEALLRTRHFEHGTRSFEKLVQRLNPSGTTAIRRSAMPPQQQIAMHVDMVDFADLIGQHTGFQVPKEIDALAPAIHQTWRELSQKEGWSMGVRYDRPFEELAPIDQRDNEAAARRIPEILALAGLGIVRSDAVTQAVEPPGDQLLSHLADHMERLAEAEHNGWMALRLRTGWRLAEVRKDATLEHDALVPYAKLSEDNKEKDRDSVRHFPARVAAAGYRIVWLT